MLVSSDFRRTTNPDVSLHLTVLLPKNFPAVSYVSFKFVHYTVHLTVEVLKKKQVRWNL